MPLDLPLGDDGVDDGPDLFHLQQQPAASTKKPAKKLSSKALKQKPDPKVAAIKKPATRQTKSKLPSSSSTAAGPGVGLGGGVSLPDDDNGDVFDFDAPAPRSILVPPQDGNMLAFDDITLKRAAAKIPSVVQHPYRDLDAILLGPPRHCMEELKDTLWEVYSVPRLQPIMNSLPGGKCRRSFDLKTFWDFSWTRLSKGTATGHSIPTAFVHYAVPTLHIRVSVNAFKLEPYEPKETDYQFGWCLSACWLQHVDCFTATSTPTILRFRTSSWKSCLG